MRYQLIFLLVSMLTLSACDNTPDITSPKQYDKHHIQLSYPGNWKITEEESDDSFSYLAIEGGDALMILQLYAKDDAVTLDEFVASFSELTKEALPFGEIVDEEFIGVKKTIMSGVRTGTKELFAIKLLGQNIPHVREYYIIESGEKVLFVISHIPTDVQATAETGFQLIFSTLAVGTLRLIP